MEDYKNNLSIEGRSIGVDITKRGKDDKHVLLNIHLEDDGSWHHQFAISSYWIDDFIKVLNRTKDLLEDEFEKEEDGFGYKY